MSPKVRPPLALEDHHVNKISFAKMLAFLMTFDKTFGYLSMKRVYLNLTSPVKARHKTMQHPLELERTGRVCPVCADVLCCVLKWMIARGPLSGVCPQKDTAWTSTL